MLTKLVSNLFVFKETLYYIIVFFTYQMIQLSCLNKEICYGEIKSCRYLSPGKRGG